MTRSDFEKKLYKAALDKARSHAAMKRGFRAQELKLNMSFNKQDFVDGGLWVFDTYFKKVESK